jgi:cytoskeleton protein RodZ
MPEIGETLRDARMRRRIDIIEVEAATKIRAKYLRALENEEWHLLPGPTFVKTFLRTYAEYLELDGRLLVEEYKRRFDQPAPQELTPFAPVAGRRRPPRHGRVGPSPAVVVGVLVVMLVGVLFAIGKLWPADDEQEAGTPNGAPATAAQEQEQEGENTQRRQGGNRTRRQRARQRRPAARRPVRLRIVPTGTVSVCLVDARGRKLIDNQNLVAGSPTPRFRSRRFRVSFGNGQARMRVNRRTVDVPDRPNPIGYDVRPGRAPRETDDRPDCS